MEFNIEIGKTFETIKKVEPRDSAQAHGSGSLEVFATPAMIALMEHCSMMCIADSLLEGWGSVGVEVCAQHLKASPIGAQIRCRAVVTEADGRKVVFSVEAFEGDALIGSGTHTRVIINNQQFMEKLQKR